MLACLKHSLFTNKNFAEIDFSKFEFDGPGSPLKRKLGKFYNDISGPLSIDWRTENSIQTRKDTISEIDLDENCSINE